MSRTKYQKTIFKNNNSLSTSWFESSGWWFHAYLVRVDTVAGIVSANQRPKRNLHVGAGKLVRRRVVKTSANGKKRSYSCNHCFSQIVICGNFGEMFRRIHWNNAVANPYYGTALAILSEIENAMSPTS